MISKHYQPYCTLRICMDLKNYCNKLTRYCKSPTCCHLAFRSEDQCTSSSLLVLVICCPACSRIHSQMPVSMLSQSCCHAKQQKMMLQLSLESLALQKTPSSRHREQGLAGHTDKSLVPWQHAISMALIFFNKSIVQEISTHWQCRLPNLKLFTKISALKIALCL